MSTVSTAAPAKHVVLVTFPETVKYLEPRKAEWTKRGVELVLAPYPAQKAECHKLLSSGSVEVLLSEPTLITEAMTLVPASAPLWAQSVYAGCEGIVSKARTILLAAGAAAATSTSASSVPVSSTAATAAAGALSHLTLTRAGQVFGQTLSEYALTAMLSRERHWPELAKAQSERKWCKPTYTNRLLSTLSVGILGASGEIGRHFAKLCKALGMTVYGFGRKPPAATTAAADAKSSAVSASANSDVDAWFYGSEKTTNGKPNGLQQVLAASDYVVSILPHTPETIGLLSGGVLQSCKPGAVLINVGRGSLLDDASLLQALEQKWLAHAVLDVFTEEPLPPTSPLWLHPSITVTPHVAALSWVVGSEIGVMFEHQLRRFYFGGASAAATATMTAAKGDTNKLEYRIDLERGY